MTRICVVPRVSGVGGMVSFQCRFAAGLEARGIAVTGDLRDSKIDAVLVIGGTRDLAGLWRVKQRGVRVVQRLNGMNWLHRRLKTGLKHSIRAETGNWLLQTIRARLVDHVIYQSEFARGWWERVYGPTRVASSVVSNAVDLSVYHPDPTGGGAALYPMPADRYRVLMVEGSLLGGYEMGLESAMELVQRLNDAHSRRIGRPVELLVAGRVAEVVQGNWSDRVAFPLIWAGLVPPENIPALDRSAHLLYSADLNAACPNSVIEALACGTPVLAFDTGALAELVGKEAGRVVSYGGDPWALDSPDVDTLAEGAVEILLDQSRFRAGARTRAEAMFGLEAMLEGYLAALLPG